MTDEEIETKLQNVPQESGIYFLKNSAGKIIYVGKAKALRNRLRSYFRENKEDTPKVKVLKAKIADFDIFVTDSEFEALVLESNMIKEHKPRYNITLKEGQYYPYLKITDEPFPRLLVTRDKEKDNSKYFGPYTNVRSLRRTLKLIKDIFRIRDCNHSLPTENIARPCLNFDIEKCDAPCVGNISQAAYQANLTEVVWFLKGKRKKLLRELASKMEKAAKNMDFKAAQCYKEQLEAVESTLRKQKVEINDFMDRDFISLATQDNLAVIIVFQLREGCVIGRQEFQFKTTEYDTDDEVLLSFIRKYYEDSPTIPREVVLPIELSAPEELQEWLTSMREERGRVKLLRPQRGRKHQLLKLIQSNAELLLKEIIITRDKPHIPKILKILKDDLYLEQLPKVIEAFDISNIGEAHPVGSMVYFFNGQSKKAEYRRFQIKTVEGQDDFSMMREVVSRRYRRLLTEGKTLPDLILVDGGKGQLSAALAALNTLGLKGKIPVASIAKKLEELFLPDRKEPITLPKTSPSLKLLQRIRNEAHRFAIEYHRKKRSEGMKASILTQIEGIGEKTQTKLLKHFKSLKEIKQASIVELQEVKGIPGKIAKKVYDFFRINSQKMMICLMVISSLTLFHCASTPRYKGEQYLYPTSPGKPVKSPEVTSTTTPERAEVSTSTFRPEKVESFQENLFKGQINLYMGTPYQYGGNTFNGIDCSGFTRNVFRDALDINLPRTAREQVQRGRAVAKANLTLGDLIFFKIKSSRVNHVGIFMSGNKFAHASASRGVTISNLNDSYFDKYYYTAKRIVNFN